MLLVITTVAAKCTGEVHEYAKYWSIGNTPLPLTCDDPKWNDLGEDVIQKIGSSGPWDCLSLEREWRFNCKNCECKIKGSKIRIIRTFRNAWFCPAFSWCNCWCVCARAHVRIFGIRKIAQTVSHLFHCADACTDELKNKCRSRNQKSCRRGVGICGDCLEGYTNVQGICKRMSDCVVVWLHFFGLLVWLTATLLLLIRPNLTANPCDDAAKNVCARAKKKTCVEGKITATRMVFWLSYDWVVTMAVTCII